MLSSDKLRLIFFENDVHEVQGMRNRKQSLRFTMTGALQMTGALGIAKEVVEKAKMEDDDPLSMAMNQDGDEGEDDGDPSTKTNK